MLIKLPLCRFYEIVLDRSGQDLLSAMIHLFFKLINICGKYAWQQYRTTRADYF